MLKYEPEDNGTSGEINVVDENNETDKENETDEDNETNEDNETDEDDDEEVGVDESKLTIPFDIPVEGVNHTLKFPLSVEWGDFQWDVAQKLHAHPAEVELSYKLASQPKADLARALVDKTDFTDLIHHLQPFAIRTKLRGRGREFCVQPPPKLAVSKSTDDKKPALVQAKKSMVVFLRGEFC